MMRAVMTPPAVSIPRERGEASRSKRSLSLLGGVTSKDGGLNGGTVGNSFIWVNRLVRLLAVEEVGDELDSTWDTGRATNEDDFVDVGLVDLRVAEHLLNRLESRAEEILAQLLDTSTSEGCVEVDTLEYGVDFDGGLSRR